LRGFALLQIERPDGVTLSQWRRAVDDAGRFLDTFGDQAAGLGWGTDDVFSPDDGLAWTIRGARVVALTRSTVTLLDGRAFHRFGQERHG
jgi:hypothetical protein